MKKLVCQSLLLVGRDRWARSDWNGRPRDPAPAGSWPQRASLKTGRLPQNLVQDFGHRAAWLCAVMLVFATVARGGDPNAAITVLPTDGYRLETTFGTNLPATVLKFTLFNSGRGTVRWALGTDAAWLELTATGGLLLPRRQAEVTAQPREVTSFAAGRYVANVWFTNVSGRPVCVLRQVVLTVRLPAPVLGAEPTFTRGTSNTISWSRVPGANEYEAQIASSLEFADAVSTGWLLATNYTWTGLPDGATRYYRVHCRSNSFVWSQTLAREFAQNDNTHVSTITSPGDLVLAGNTNRLWVETFEAPGASWTNTLFNDLSYAAWPAVFDKGIMDAGSLAPDTVPRLPVNQGDDQVGRLYYTPGWHRYAHMASTPETQLRDATIDAYLMLTARGAYHYLEGAVLLRANTTTGTGEFGGDTYLALLRAWGPESRTLELWYLSHGIFGVGLSQPGEFITESPEENYHLKMSARSNAITAALWRVVSTNGILRESPVDLGRGTNLLAGSDSRQDQGVAGLGGIAWPTTDYLSPCVFFDDVTLQAHEFPPQYAANGSSTASVTPPNWFERWGRLDFTSVRSTPKAGLTVDVLDASGVLLAAAVASGTDLDSLPSIRPQRCLRLRANFSTADPTQTAALSDWTVTYHLPAENASESAWSAPAVSAQDNTPPVLTVTWPTENPYVTTNAVVTFSGTALDTGSGIASVSIDILAVRTTNGFPNWTLTVPLSPWFGSTFVIVARDKAVPANRALATNTVIYQQPGGFYSGWPAAPASLLTPPDDSSPTPPGPLMLDRSPTLHIEYAENAVVITWAPALPGYRLQTATTLTPADWTEVLTGSACPARLAKDTPCRFFRLVLR